MITYSSLPYKIFKLFYIDFFKDFFIEKFKYLNEQGNILKVFGMNKEAIEMQQRIVEQQVVALEKAFMREYNEIDGLRRDIDKKRDSLRQREQDIQYARKTLQRIKEDLHNAISL